MNDIYIYISSTYIYRYIHVSNNTIIDKGSNHEKSADWMLMSNLNAWRDAKNSVLKFSRQTHATLALAAARMCLRESLVWAALLL